MRTPSKKTRSAKITHKLTTQFHNLQIKFGEKPQSEE